MRPLSLSLACLLAAGMVLARENEQPKDPSYAKEGALEAHLIASDRGAEILGKWARGESLTLKSVETVMRGEFITVIVRFLGCKADQSGLCNATVGYVAYKPDGTVYGEMPNAELWLDKLAPATGASQLAVEYMGLVIEPTDPVGHYKVVATVHDHNAGSSLVVWRAFEVPTLPSMGSASTPNNSLQRTLPGGVGPLVDFVGESLDQPFL